MKHGKKTVWTGIAVLCLIACVLSLGFVWYASVSGSRDSDTKTDMKMEGLRLTLANLSAAQIQADKDFVQQIKDELGLLSMPLRSIVTQEKDKAIQNYVYGCVLRRDGDDFILPEDTTSIPMLEPQTCKETMPYTPDECDPFRDREGAFWSLLQGTEEKEYVLCAYRQIVDDYYYLYYMPLSAVETFYQTRYDTAGVITGAETVYDGYFVAWIEDEGDYQYFYGSSIFEGYEQPEEMGISIANKTAGFQATTIDDVKYMYEVSSPLRVPSIGKSIRIAYIIPYENYYGTTYSDSVVLLFVAFAFFLALTVWVLASRRVMSGKTVTQTQRKRYGARRMRRVAASLGAAGFVTILLAGMFMYALSGVYYSTTTCQSALDTLNTMAKENSSHEDYLSAQRSEQYLSHATRISILLGLYPDLMTREQLAEMSETIGADYLMLFDDEGNETLSDSPYVNLTYGTEEGNSTYDFRRLIAGVPSIIHPVCVDEVTGLNRQLIGVSMDDGDITDGYGSLIIAIEPKAADENSLSMGDIMSTLTMPDGMIFAVDKSGKTVVSASKSTMIGKNIVEMGMSEKNLREGFMDFFSLDGKDLYGCSIEQDGYLYYSAVKTDSMFDNLFVDSLIPALMFLAAYALLACVLLAGYTEKNIDKSGIEVIDDHDWDYREKEQEELEHVGWWTRKTPEGKRSFVLMTLIAVGIASLLGVYSAGGMQGGIMAIIPFVLSGAWTRGFNLLALTRIVVLAGGVALILLGMKALLSLLCSFLETKGETICRLCFSLLRYAVIIVALFYCLEALGFDTTTLLASLGIFSLAISLGAKDLVADVLSGITIVFSGEYQIGNIVEIGGFRGRVWEIGIRTTTVVSKDGTMKNISNRNVSNVMNLSRLNSRYSMQISIPYDQPLDKVEEILKKELPSIGRKIGDIADGPHYLGVTGMDAGHVTLGFYAECAEEDMDKVCDKMNVALKALFEKHQIPFK